MLDLLKFAALSGLVLAVLFSAGIFIEWLIRGHKDQDSNQP